MHQALMLEVSSKSFSFFNPSTLFLSAQSFNSGPGGLGASSANAAGESNFVRAKINIYLENFSLKLNLLTVEREALAEAQLTLVAKVSTVIIIV